MKVAPQAPDCARAPKVLDEPGISKTVPAFNLAALFAYSYAVLVQWRVCFLEDRLPTLTLITPLNRRSIFLQWRANAVHCNNKVSSQRTHKKWQYNGSVTGCYCLNCAAFRSGLPAVLPSHCSLVSRSKDFPASLLMTFAQLRFLGLYPT